VFTPGTEQCCGNNKYTLATQFCIGTATYDKCGGTVAFTPGTEQCCGNYKYTLATQFCVGTATYDKCGGTVEYNPTTEQCCGNNKYTLATHYCHTDNQTYSCGSKPYNPSTQFCVGTTIYSKCGGSDYDPSTQFCVGTATYDKCGGTVVFTPGTEQCCGSDKYTLATQFCVGTTTYDKCGGTVEYNPATEQCCGSNKYTKANQFCSGNAIYSKCGGSDYDPSTQFCYNSNEIANFCGNRTQDLDKYDPDKYECRAATNPNGIYLKSNIEYDGKVYKAVLIGEQTWMAENLNYNVSGSKCNNNADAYCTTYGRLYDWATAMGFDANCNTNSCASQINAKHRGICPSGWHVSSDADWTTLTNFVGTTPGTKLKAKSGWNSGGNGLDDYGFTALPGGYTSDGSVGSGYVGYIGCWWNTSELGYRYMNNGDSVDWSSSGNKAYLRSVRCVQD
jgi:uncharacterized protein (TIGR02145 family)